MAGSEEETQDLGVRRDAGDCWGVFTLDSAFVPGARSLHQLPRLEAQPVIQALPQPSGWSSPT